MACGVALKRSYDDYLNSEAGEVKRARHTQAHCSPFRAQIGTIAAFLPTTGNSSLLQFNGTLDDEANISPFAAVDGRMQLTSGQLESYLRAEVRYLKRRHLIPRRTLSNSSVENIGIETGGSSDLQSAIKKSAPRSYREAPSSPNANSGSDSDSECCIATKVSSLQKPLSMQQLYEKPQFSLKQVQMICERLLKQQELRLRYEYETVLNQRLEEQHGQYVQFAREQIELHHCEDSATMSYLS